MIAINSIGVEHHRKNSNNHRLWHEVHKRVPVEILVLWDREEREGGWLTQINFGGTYIYQTKNWAQRKAKTMQELPPSPLYSYQYSGKFESGLFQPSEDQETF